MRKNYSSAKPAPTKGFNMFAVLFSLAFLFAANSFANTYPGSWTSVTPASRCAGVSTTFTLVAFNPTSAGGVTANSFVAVGEPIIITFPAGTTFGALSGSLTSTSNNCAMGIGTTALGAFSVAGTVVTVNTTRCIDKATTFTIVINNVINPSPASATNYQLSMTIDNASATSPSINNFVAGVNSQYNIMAAMNYGTVTAGNQSICAGDVPAVMNVTGAAGSTSFAYQWYYQNGIVGCPSGASTSGWTALGIADGSGYNTATFTPAIAPGGTLTYACFITPGGAPTCGTARWVTSCRQVTVNALTAVSVQIQASSPSSGFGPFVLCSATSYTLTATPTNGGTNPTYEWFVNAVSQQNSTSATFIWTLNAGEVVTCQMTVGTGITCPTGGNPAYSNQLNFNAAGAVTSTPAQATPFGTRCKGGGTSTTPNFTYPFDVDIARFEWQIQSAGTSTIASPTTVNNTTITWDPNFVGVAQIRMRPNNICLSSPGGWGPWRNDTVLAHFIPVSFIDPDFSARKGLNGGAYWDTICHRTNVTFSNLVNSINQPYPYGAATYEWYWNNTMVQSSNLNTYLNNNLLDNDTVRLQVIPGWTTTTTTYSDGNRCPSSVPFNSNTYYMDVYPSDPPAILTVSASPNPGCQGQAITLTATLGPDGLGNAPQYQWYDVATGPISGATNLTYIGTFTPGMHDIFFMVTSSDTCASPSVVTAPSPFYSLQVDLCYDTMNMTGNMTINRCGGVLYDSGGPTVNYSNNESGVLSVCPALAGQYVSLSFTSFATEATNDVLTIYNGTSITDPILAPSPLSGTMSCSAPFTSSHASGCLTLRFVSNGTNTQAGWAANMSCVTTPASTTPGNGCASPVMIASLPYSVTGQTNQCFGNNQGSGCATGNYTGTDKFYRYDASGPECITVNINGATSNAISLTVWKDCPTAPGTCVAQWTTATGGNLGGQTTLPMVGTYFIIVDAATGVNFTYNLVINTFGAAPLNDLPCNAEPLIQTIPHYDDNSCAGTESGGGVNNSNCVSGNINSLWYTFNTNAGQTSVRIRYIPGVGTLPGNGIATQIYSGSCSSLSYLTCSTIYTYPGAMCTGSGSGWVFTVSPSTTYYIRIDGAGNYTGNFQIIVDDPNNTTPAYGYDCGNPIAISAQTCTYGSPAFIGVGNRCDFPYNNNAGFYGERDGVYYLFKTIYGQNGATTLTFDIYSDPSVTTDWDFIIWNVTPYYPNQICEYLNYSFGPWNTSAGNISSSWVDTWQAPANGHTGCRVTGSTHINGFPFNAPIPLSSTQGSPAGEQWWMLYVSNFRFSQYPYGFTLEMGHSTTSTTSNYNPTSVGAVVYNTTAPPQLIWWTGQGANTNWLTQANWGGCAVPSCANNTSATVASYYSPSNPYFPVVGANGAITKDLTIRPGGSVTLNSGFNLNVCGNWLNMGTFTAQSNSSVTCTGNSTQFFDGIMSGSNSFENLNMSKTPGVNMYLYNKAQVKGTLGLTNGRIITQAKELFVSNLSPSSVPIGGTSSFVQGNLRRNLDPTGGVYYWPVGLQSSPYQLAKLTFGAGLTIPNILGYFNSWSSLPAPTGLIDGACSGTYTSAPGFLDNGYWTLTASANPTGAQYDMVLYNNNVTNGGGSTSWTVVKAPSISGGWMLDGNCDGTSTQTATKRNGMTGFSVFATAQSSVPVPITLLNFDAVAKGTGVQTTWVTASEINNDYFVVERSADGINFEQVGTRKGAGNSTTTLYYSMLDITPLRGVSYYRLRQVDFDGQESKSQLVAVSFLENNVLNVFPNPAQTAIQYRFNSAADGVVNFELIDALGKVIVSQAVNVTKGLNTSEAFDISFLPQGVYFIQLKPTGSEIIEPMQKRFIKQTREE